jgi:hypothetical protein
MDPALQGRHPLSHRHPPVRGVGHHGFRADEGPTGGSLRGFAAPSHAARVRYAVFFGCPDLRLPLRTSEDEDAGGVSPLRGTGVGGCGCGGGIVFEPRPKLDSNFVR